MPRVARRFHCSIQQETYRARKRRQKGSPTADCEIRFRDSRGECVTVHVDEFMHKICREGICDDKNQRRRDRRHGVVYFSEMRKTGDYEDSYSNPEEFLEDPRSDFDHPVRINHEQYLRWLMSDIVDYTASCLSERNRAKIIALFYDNKSVVAHSHEEFVTELPLVRLYSFGIKRLKDPSICGRPRNAYLLNKAFVLKLLKNAFEVALSSRIEALLSSPSLEYLRHI